METRVDRILRLAKNNRVISVIIVIGILIIIISTLTDAVEKILNFVGRYSDRNRPITITVPKTEDRQEKTPITTTYEEARQRRNRKLLDLILRVDEHFMHYERSIYDTNDTKISTPVLIARMHCLRDTKRKDIDEKMKQGIQKYSLEEGLIDIQEYLYSGTIYGALQDSNKKNVTPTDSFEGAKKYKEEIVALFKEYGVKPPNGTTTANGPVTGEKRLNESNP